MTLSGNQSFCMALESFFEHAHKPAQIEAHVECTRSTPAAACIVAKIHARAAIIIHNPCRARRRASACKQHREHARDENCGSLISRVAVDQNFVKSTICSGTQYWFQRVFLFFWSVEKYNEPRINADERRFVNRASAFICVHLRLIESKEAIATRK